MSIFRRMLEGTAILRMPDAGDGTAAPDAGSPQDAGGAEAQPDAGSQSADAGTAAGNAADGATDPPQEGEPTGSAPPAAQQPDPVQRKINQLVAERWTERRGREAAEQQARLLQEQLNQTRQAFQAQPQVDADGNPLQQQQPQRATQPQPDLQALVREETARNEFNKQVGEEVQKGRGLHQDFDQVAANLQRFGELPRTFVEAALATGKGADVMYALGGDIAEADRILSMGPMQQAVALAQLAGGLKAPEPAKKVTSAAAPIVPKIGSSSGKNTPSLEDPNMPVADWIKLREKNLPKRASR